MAFQALKRKTAIGLLRASRFARQKTKSQSANRLVRRFTQPLRAYARSNRPPRKFFPFEKFVSAQELNSAEVNHAFEQIRKGLWWKSNQLEISALAEIGAMIGPIFFIGLPVASIASTRGEAVATAGAVIGMLSIGNLLYRALKLTSTEKPNLGASYINKKGLERVQANVSVLKQAMTGSANPRLRQILNSRQFNIAIIDLEHDGFRFGKVLPKDQELIIRLQNEAKNGAVIVFDQNGKLQYGVSLDNGKQFLPQSEQREGTGNRRTGNERRMGIERRQHVESRPAERRKFQERRKGEQRKGPKDRRAPKEERTEYHM